MVIILIVALLVNGFQVGSRPIDAQFRDIWRWKAVEVLERHVQQHTDCPLVDVIKTLRNAQIFKAEFTTTRIWATSFPNKDAPWPTILINPYVKWSERAAVICLIHEGLHLTWVDGRFICLEDNIKRANGWGRQEPACDLFGAARYAPRDIDDGLSEHLKRELAGLEGK